MVKTGRAVVAAVRRPGPLTAVWVLAGLQLAMGIAAQISYWNVMPVWYHLVFLALLVPATVAGGRLGQAGMGRRVPV